MATVLDKVKHYQLAIEIFPNDEQKVLMSINGLHKLDVTVQHLQETGVGRTVNALRKEQGEVGKAARALVLKWKRMVAAEDSDGDSNNDTHNGHVSTARDPYDDSMHSLKTLNYQNDRSSSYDTQYKNMNGSHSGVKRKYSSGEEETDLNKKKKISNSKKDHSESDEEDLDLSQNDLYSDHIESSDEEISKRKEKISDNHRHKGSHKSNSESHKSSDTDKHSKIEHRSETKEKISSKDKQSHSSHKSSRDRDHKEKKSTAHTSSSEKVKYVKESSSSKHKSSSSKHKSSKSDNDSEKHKSDTHKSDKHSSKFEKSKSHKHKKETSENKTSSEKESSVETYQLKDTHSSKEKYSSSSKKKSNDKSSSSKEKSENQRAYKKSSDSKSKHSESRKHKKEKKDKHKDSSETRHKHSSSHKSKSSSSSNKSKDVPKNKEEVSNGDSDDGIDCGSGASFAEALGMISPAKPKKKEKNLIKDAVSPVAYDMSPSALLAPTAKLAPLPAIEISALPEISPNYKPRPPPKLLPHFTDDEAMSAVISSKNQRTKVYSGNKVYGKIPTLYEMCVHILQEHIDALEYTGGVPYDILKPVVDRATPQQLFSLEHFNPYLMEDTDHLWQKFCETKFRNKQRQEMETWREMFMRCQEEQEYRLKSLTANIKIAQEAKKAPIKQTKMAYVDTVVKPPRNIARKQAQHGTAHAAAGSPAARVAALAAAPNVLRGSMRPTPATPFGHTFKPKKAPLMQKALQFMRGRKR